MTVKEQSKQKANNAAKKRLRRNTSPKLGQIEEELLPRSIVQRAETDPGSLEPRDVLQLQRTLGNRAVGDLLTKIGPQPIAQPKLKVGLADNSGNQTVVIRRILSEKELMERGEKIREISQGAPSKGGNLWLLENEKIPTKLYLLGTMHGRLLWKMAQGKELVRFLSDTAFDQVYTEIAEKGTKIDLKQLIDDMDILATPLPAEDSSRATKLRDKQKRYDAQDRLEKVGTLDQVYNSLASKGEGSKGLETDETREAIRKEYAEKSPKNKAESRYEDYESVEEWVTKGDEKSLMEYHAKYLFQGIDIQDIEARNRQWAGNVTPEYHPKQTVIWIVGASHLGGLIVEMGNSGWKAKPVTL